MNPGGAVDVECRVANKEGECRWEKSGNPIGIFPGKYEWAAAGGPADGDCSLRVINASLEYDDGIWQCQVRTQLGCGGGSMCTHGGGHATRVWPIVKEVA